MVVGKLVVRQGICESRFFLKPGAGLITAGTCRGPSTGVLAYIVQIAPHMVLPETY
jgi:hypothetical protein